MLDIATYRINHSATTRSMGRYWSLCIKWRPNSSTHINTINQSNSSSIISCIWKYNFSILLSSKKVTDIILQFIVFMSLLLHEFIILLHKSLINLLLDQSVKNSRKWNGVWNWYIIFGNWCMYVLEKPTKQLLLLFLELWLL